MSIAVSIIVPCYNYGNFLGDTLTSLLNQTLTNWECLIVDDGSSDNSAEVANAYCNNDSRFSYIYQENSGLSAARNTGLQFAKGEFIQFLDADDILSEEKLRLQVKFMEENKDVGLSYTDAFYFPDWDKGSKNRAFYVNDEGEPCFADIKWIKEFNESGSTVIEYLLWKNIAPVNSFLIRADVVKQVGEFNTSYKSLEDWNFWSRCAISGAKFSYLHIPEAYALIRVHTASMSFNKRSMSMYFNKIQMEICELIRKHVNADYPGVYQKNRHKIIARVQEEIYTNGVNNYTYLKELYKCLPLFIFIDCYMAAIKRDINTETLY